MCAKSVQMFFRVHIKKKYNEGLTLVFPVVQVPYGLYPQDSSRHPQLSLDGTLPQLYPSNHTKYKVDSYNVNNCVYTIILIFVDVL